MKAVIVDLLNGQAAALCEDGRVVKLADAGYSLGQKIEVHARRRARSRWLRAVSTAAAAAVLVLGIGGAAWATPYGVVTLDVNPSLEYTINCFDYVLSVSGVNADGRQLLAGMDQKQLVRRHIGDALSASVAQLEAEDWLQTGEEVLLAAGARRDGHAEKLLNTLQAGLSRGDHALEVRAFAVSRAEIEAAHETGMSAGRRHVLGELGEAGGEPFSADWAERPVADLLQELDGSRPPRGADRGEPERAAQEKTDDPRPNADNPALRTEPDTGAVPAKPDAGPRESGGQEPPEGGPAFRTQRDENAAREQTPSDPDGAAPERAEARDSAPDRTTGENRLPADGQSPGEGGPDRRTGGTEAGEGPGGERK